MEETPDLRESMKDLYLQVKRLSERVESLEISSVHDQSDSTTKPGLHEVGETICSPRELLELIEKDQGRFYLADHKRVDAESLVVRFEKLKFKLSVGGADWLSVRLVIEFHEKHKEVLVSDIENISTFYQELIRISTRHECGLMVHYMDDNKLIPKTIVLSNRLFCVGFNEESFRRSLETLSEGYFDINRVLEKL